LREVIRLDDLKKRFIFDISKIKDKNKNIFEEIIDEGYKYK
jgi:hypothetical protein